MKTIVFIGTQKSGSSREAIKAAERLGYYTVLLTDRKTFLEKRTEFHDVHLMQLCNLGNTDEIKNAIRKLTLKALDICAIVSFVDPYCPIASAIAEDFGLDHFSTKAMEIMTNKIFSRIILSGSPYAPYFNIIDKDLYPKKEDLEEKLPVVLKSPNSTGSKDVIKINSYDEYETTVKKFLTKYPKDPILIEEFLEGEQYLIETVVYRKDLYIIAVIHQHISFDKRFIVTGYSLMIDIPKDFYNKLKTAVEYIVRAHGMEYGTCHLEMRYVKDEFKLIEINPRISGAGMNKLIEIGLGINLVEETLKMQLNQSPDFEPKFRRETFAQYITASKRGILQKVTGRNKAYKCPGVRYIYTKPRKGSVLTPPLSMGDRYAYVIANGETSKDAEENAKYAASQIKFITSEDFNKINAPNTETIFLQDNAIIDDSIGIITYKNTPDAYDIKGCI